MFNDQFSVAERQAGYVHLVAHEIIGTRRRNGVRMSSVQHNKRLQVLTGPISDFTQLSTRLARRLFRSGRRGSSLSLLTPPRPSLMFAVGSLTPHRRAIASARQFTPTLRIHTARDWNLSCRATSSSRRGTRQVPNARFHETPQTSSWIRRGSAGVRLPLGRSDPIRPPHGALQRRGSPRASPLKLV